MVATIFSILSILAIVAGGLVSAFSARRPSRASAWVSAYLVLVVGIIQLGLVAAWQHLGQRAPGVALPALLVYNFGNLGVILGTLLKEQLTYYRVLVNTGGFLIAVAMAMLLVAERGAHLSWALAGFVALAAAVLIIMPIGLTLSARRHKTIKARG